MQKHYALLFLLATMWSGSFAFIKIGVQSVGPLTLTWARLAIAAVILDIWLKIKNGRLPSDLQSWGVFAFIGLVGNALPFSLISWGETRIDSGLTAILMGVMPVTTALLAHAFIKDEPFNGRTGLALAIGFCGLMILLGADALAGLTGPLLAQIAVLFSAVCYGASATFTRYFTTQRSGAAMASGTMIAAFAWMTPITLIVEQPLSQSPTLAGLLAIAYLGIFPTGLAMLIFFYLIAQLGVNRFAQVNYIVPVLGALWGMVFLGEPFSWKLAIALGLVLLSINIVRSRPT